MTIRKVLVANRGEIAVRVLRTLREMGLDGATVHTEHDRAMPHAAGESIEVASYLSIPEVVGAARRAGAQAIHPGYGFLAENPALPRACRDAGLLFIGPTAEAMEALGDKASARCQAQKLGIPVASGEGPFSDPAAIEAAARRLGPPLMLKASGGGGGKGMKRLHHLEDLPDQIATSQRESSAAFHDDRLIVERYVEPARHVEVQVMGDGKAAIALGERECSLQRRHQKIIEESPSPAVDGPLREKLCQAARVLAASVGYAGAGTVEFLLSPDGSYYFLEMNARLQVEHPVTELRTGLDLVRLQVELAQGGTLPRQEEVTFRGHAIEARLCAEDPRQQFLPSSGRILKIAWPAHARVDTGVGPHVSTHYDSLLAKIVTRGIDREQARRRLVKALEETVLLGVVTNQEYLLALLQNDAFVRAETYTTTVDALHLRLPEAPRILAVAAAMALRERQHRPDLPSPWTTVGLWRLS